MLIVEKLVVSRDGKTVLQDVSLKLAPGRALAVIGESGSGKTTLIGAILGLIPKRSGTVTWAGAPVSRPGPALVMQEPRAAFNPALALRRSVMEPLRGKATRLVPGRLETLCAGLEIDPAILDRRPDQVSIGQAQRIGILRALIAAPPLVLFDEPLSALDAVTQKRTAQLIARLQADEGFASLIVTHDLGYAAAHADDVVVLKAGIVEEAASAEAFFRSPESGYGRRLRDAAFAIGALGKAA